jgi:hypothetical protein
MTADRRSTVVVLPVLAHLVLFAVFVVWDSWRGSGVAWSAQGLTCAPLVSQLGLLSVWAGLGRGRWLHRLAAVGAACFAGVAILTASRSVIWGRITFVEVLFVVSGIILVMVFPVVVVLAVVRRLGWRLVLFSSRPPPPGTPLRFSVRHLLALTAVAAGFLSAGYYARPLATFEQNALWVSPGTSAWVYVAVTAVGLLSFLAAPLLAVWACLGVGRPGLRLLIAGFFCLALSSLRGYYFGGAIADYALLAGAAVLHLAIIAATLLVFRAVGYRLVRHPDEGEAEEPVVDSD